MGDVDKYLRRILATYPSVKWRNAELITDNGLDYAVVILDRKKVFRFPRKEGSPSTSLSTEMKLLDKLKPLVNIEVPNYIYKNYSFGGYNLIHGEELDTANLPKELKSKRTSSKVAKFLTALHNFDINKAKRMGVKSSEDYGDIAKDYRKKLNFISKKLSKKEIGFIKTALNELESFEYNERCLIHGDLCGGHILIRKNKISGVIDFGDAEIGDPSMDFAIFWDFGKDFMKNLYNRYKGPKDEGLLRRAELNNLRLHISNIYWGIKIKKENWFYPSLKILKKIIKRGFHTHMVGYVKSSYKLQRMW